jgi:hypothetical protein
MQGTEKERCTNVQYIRLTKEKKYEDLKGRYTVLDKGVPGFILNEHTIDHIVDITERQRGDCWETFAKAQETGRTFALVQGYPCILNENDFYRCEAPKMYPVPGEII